MKTLIRWGLIAVLLAVIAAGAGWALTPDAPEQPAVQAAPEARAGSPARVRRDVVYIERDNAPTDRTSLDIYQPAVPGSELGADAAETVPALMPVLLYIHGGGWAIGDKARVHEKAAWANRNGWVFVSVNYRLSPAVMHPEHARDVAAAVAWVEVNAQLFGADPSRIALIGHSAGAHLAAIVASDESLLAEHGMSPADLSGVVLLDGAGYHLPRRMASMPDNRLGRMYADAFGDDPALWEQASPTLQARPGDTLPVLFCVHAGRRVESAFEGQELVNAWEAAGAEATMHHARSKNHMTVNRSLGDASDADTKAIEGFLHRVLAD